MLLPCWQIDSLEASILSVEFVVPPVTYIAIVVFAMLGIPENDMINIICRNNHATLEKKVLLK